VLQDVTCNLLKHELVEEMANAMITMPLSSFKALFDKIVHSSIMKLNSTSMDKVLLSLHNSNSNTNNFIPLAAV